MAVAQSDLGNGQLRILGTSLDITPQAQTVPVGTPTIVRAVLQAPAGSLPASVTVRGELTGPGIAGSLQLSAEPNGAFAIPGQIVRGTYVLSNIRLMDGESFVSYAVHRDATITVTDLLIAQVTSRPLTYQEMIDKGIVVSSKNFRAYSFVFALQLESRLQQFEVPIIFPEFGPPVLPSIPRTVGQAPLPEGFSPPQVRAVRWSCADIAEDVARGLQYVVSLGAPIELPCGFVVGGGPPGGDASPDTRPVLTSLLLIPGDVAFLNQFFSLTVLAQNGAPTGSNLRLENLTARASLPPALRPAETNPPTNFNDPVPIVDPGPDGKLGTADDITFLLAQSVGKAEFLVEGLRSGRWDVPIELNATLRGLPAGPVPLRGTTVGSVLVRNPSFFVTLDHPDVIREGEEYTISATVANTSSVQANQVSVKLDRAFIVGAQLLSDELLALGDLAPGGSALGKFRLKALRTGRVTSDAFYGEGPLAGSVVLHAGIGELSIPLNPDTLVFPRSVDQLPAGLIDPARRLLGLAWSIAKSPDGRPPANLPQVGEQAVRWRVDDLILAARHKDLGEAESVALSDFTLGWLNSGAEKSAGFDQLRRASVKGAELATAWGAQLTNFWQAETPFDYQKRIAAALPERRFLSAVLSTGIDAQNPSARLVLAGRSIPGRAQLFSGESGYERTLTSAELYRASKAGTQYEVGLVGALDPGGYQIQIAGKRADNVTLTVTYPGANGKLVYASFGPFPVAPGSLASLDLVPGADPTQLILQGIPPVTGSLELAPRPPLTLLSAVQDLEADPKGHAVSLLFNRSLTAGSTTEDKTKYEIRSSYGVNPTSVVIHQIRGGARDPRVVIVGIANQPSPYGTTSVRATQLADSGGTVQSPDPQIVNLVVRDRRPGGTVEGTVVGANGQPVGNASVVLRVPEKSDTTGQTFLADFASTTANASGQFFFEYVQIRQGQVFDISAADPATGFDGDASGQVRTEAERVVVNVVLLARGDVTGKVVDEAGTPIPNAYVTAESVFFKSNQNRGSTNSAANGTYLFRSLPAGPVQLWAIDPVSRKSAFAVAQIPSAGGTATKDIVIVRSPRASISGDVIREGDGRPAAGLYVAAYGEPVSVPYGSGSDRKYFGFRITDPQGRFSFADVQAGADLIQVYDFSRGRFPVLDYTLQILPDSQTVLHLVVLEPQTRFGSVEGLVRLNTSGTLSPLAKVVVTASESLAWAVTDAAGRYRLDAVPIGTRSVRAYEPATQRQQTQSATVQDGLVSPLNFVFDAVPSGSRTIRGNVLDPFDRPVPAAAVAEFDGSGNVLRSAVADSTGQFVFTDVPPGNHTFFALGRDDTSGTLRDDVGGASINFPGTGEGSITIRLAGWATVRGRVLSSHLDDLGNPVDSPVAARVVLTEQRLLKVGQFGFFVGPGHPLYTGPREADSSAIDGSYSFTYVLGAPYSILAHHALFGDRTASGTLRAGQIAVHDFRYENALSWIDGFLYDQQGNPIPRADVDLWQGAAPAIRDDPRNPPYATVQTLSDPADPRGLGYFRFLALPNRNFTLAFNGLVNGVRRFDQAYVTVGGVPHAIRVTLRARVVQDARARVLQPDAAGELQPVSAASVRVTETDWPNRSFRLDTAADGTVLFPGISEGRFTINAQRLSRAGSGGGCVCADGGTVEVTIVLPGSGTVRGTVRFPGTSAPVESAQVLVLSGGNPVAAAQTDANGLYQIDGIDLNRSLAVRVKDNASARFGFGADFVLAANGETVTRDVTLLALGNVSGTFADASGRGIPGATVVLRSDSLLGQTLFYSGTDGSGRFSFAGIPQGSYALSSQDPVTRLSGANEGNIATEGSTVTTNLRAQASGTLDVTVRSSSGAALAVPPILTLLAQGIPPRTVIATQFSFRDVPLGAFTLAAEEQASPPKRRAVLTGRLTANAEVQNLELRYVPYGSVNVRVVRVNPEGGEVPLTRGSVSLHTEGVYRGQFPFDVWVNVNASGLAQFVNVGGGELTATYRDPVTGVQSEARGGLASEGSTVELTVRVFNLSDVSGRVMKPPPVSTEPAVGAFASLGGRTAVTDANGRFTFDGVAFGNYEIALEAAGIGRGRRSFSLSSANAPLDLGTLILDGTPPSVVEVSPASGATGLSRNPLFTILFSEPVQIARSDLIQAASSFHVRQGSFSLSPDRRTLSWQANTLDPATSYQLRILAGAVTDDSGWPSTATFLSSFTTRDDLGPVVIQTAPIADAIQVSVSTTVLAIFDKDLDLSTITASALTLEKTVPAVAAVAGTVARGANDRTVVFTPNAAALETQSRYQARVAGLRDTTGNPMAQPYSFSFWTRDDVSPAVTFDPPPASPFYSGNNYTLTLRWTDPDIRSIETRVNGYYITTLAPPLSARSATFTYWVSPDDTAAEHVLTARPTDYSGNTGATARLTVPLVTDRRPTVSIQVTSATTLSAGSILSGRVTASDDRGLTLLKLYVSGVFSTSIEWTDVAGLTSATRDFSIVVPVSASVGGAVTLRAEATDNNDRRQVGSVTDGSVSVTRDTVPPVIANVSPAGGTSVLGVTEVQISADVTDNVALRNVSLDRPGSRIVGQNGNRFTLAFVTPSAAGDVTATLTATDFGNNSATASVLLRVQANAPPTGTLSVSPAGPLSPNAETTATVDAQDDIGLGRVEVRASGALSGWCYFPLSGTSQRVTCQVRVRGDASPGSSGSVQADIYDAQGQKTSTAPVTVMVTTDTTPPVISNVRPLDGETYSSGDAVLVGASVSDDFGVASVDITVDGTTTRRTELPYEITYRAKRVSSPEVVPIRIEARDRAGNLATATRSITVNPLVNSVPPTVSMACPTSGALFPPGHTFVLSAAATDDGAVEKVEFFLNDEAAPFFTDTAAPYETSYTVPASLAEGATFTLRAKAWDFAGNTASAQSLVRVVQGEIVSGDLTIAAGDTSRDGRTLIITSGLTTIDGPHSFARLVVLAAARVTRSSVTTLREDPLDLNVSGTVFVACGGSITVNGKGYLGGHAPGNVFNEGMTLGNVRGSGINAGGSHGGKGGEAEPERGFLSAPVYGSITRPRTSGGGGGTGYFAGNNGGGVIVLRAGSLIVDGALSSEGEGPNNVGGAGGSIDIETGTLSGSGRISASGSYGYSGSAGGGRVAVRYTDMSSFDRARVIASGGDSAYPSKGSSGTVYFKSAAQTYGDLIIDNVRNTLVRNPLPPAGQTLRFDNVIARNYAKVISQDEIVAAFSVDSTSYVATPSRDAAPTATLSTNPTGTVFPGNTLAITIAATDDNELESIAVQVTGPVTFAQSRLARNTKSRTETFNVAIPIGTPSGTLSITATVTDAFARTTTATRTVAISSDSTPPVLSNAQPADGATFRSGEQVYVAVQATDDTGIASIEIVVDGVTRTFTNNPAPAFWWRAKPVSAATTVAIRFTARDLAGNTTTLNRSITVNPISNPNPPRVAMLCPTTGALFPAGYTFTLSADATDDQEVARVEFYLNAETTPFFVTVTAPYQTTYTVPAALSDGSSFTLRAKAWDWAANTAEAQALITVVAGDTISANATIGSGDTSRDGRTLIIAGGTTTIQGPHSFARLVVLSGANVTQIQTTSATTPALDLNVAGRVYIACGGAVDVSGKGYLGARQPGNPNDYGLTFGSQPGAPAFISGSHGGGGSGRATTYGSLFNPTDPGSGGGVVNGSNPGGNGGGVVRLQAGSVTLDGSILANGAGGSYYSTGGSGGSVRLDTATLSGSGLIRAAGSGSRYGTGGGGRVAVYFGNISGFDRNQIKAAAGSESGGAGSVYLKASSSSFGEAVFDNDGVYRAAEFTGIGLTPLPSIGSGTITGVSGSTITDSSKTFPYSVVGYSVEIRRGGSLVGMYRVASHSGGTLTLDQPVAGTVQTGDAYQGVVRLDVLNVRDGARLETQDVIHATNLTSGPGALARVPPNDVNYNPETYMGHIQAPLTRGDSLTMPNGFLTVTGPLRFATGSLTNRALLTHRSSTGTTTGLLDLEVTGALTIDATSRIDASWRGYLGAYRPGNPSITGQTWQHASGSGQGSGGSHGGRGGYASAPAYGSLFDPREAGGGGGAGGAFGSDPGSNGGGTVRLRAGSLVLNGSILADAASGAFNGTGGAGGSIYLDVGSLSGTGLIAAGGGRGWDAADGGSGGAGGRIAILYNDLSGFDRTRITAQNSQRWAGAGTVLFKSSGQTYGELVVDNRNEPGGLTYIPWIGGGTVTAVSGATLTDSSKTFPYSVVGLTVDIKRGETAVGTYRVVSHTGGTLTLDQAVEGTVQVGDTYQGVLRLDVLTARNRARVITQDQVAATTLNVDASSYLAALDRDAEPTATLTANPPATVSPGGTLVLTVAATDDNELDTIEVRVTGPVTFNQSRSARNLTSRTEVFNVPIPFGTPSGSLSVTATVKDTWGHSKVVTATIAIAPDSTPPTLSNPRPPDGASFAAGQSVIIGVDATDDVGVASVDIVVDGVATTKTAAPYQITYIAKPVATPTIVPIRFIARDGAGNTATLDWSITVTPISNPNPPVLQLQCPTPGALFPAGYTIPISVIATDDQAVARVEFLLDPSATPFATVTAAPYNTTYTVPSGLADGATFTLRVKAYDYALNITEATIPVTVVAGDVISTDTTIGTADTSHDGRTLILAGGTTTISGPHTFARLVVLSGAKATHDPPTSSTPRSLTVNVTGAAYVACGGTIDVTGKGYLGGLQPGNSSTSGQSYPGVSVSGKRSGGSHGGKGGATYPATEPVGDVFGSLFDPVEGGGGGGLEVCCGAAGGGIIRLQAGSLAVDGQILADGSRFGTPGNTGTPGGGGSIRLDVGTLTGAGTIRAAGGEGTGGYWVSAGGGRVAIYGDASGFDRSRAQARGGTAWGVGGPGTVYFKAPTQSYGDLIVENGGNLGPATPLPAIGSGTVTAVSGSTLTDSSKTFPYSVVGLYVEVKRGTTAVGTYRVLSQSGSTLTLDTAIQGTVLVGDTYQGLYRFDSVTVRGNAEVVSADPLRVGTLLSGGSGQSGTLRAPLSGDSLTFNGGTVSLGSAAAANFTNVTLQGGAVLTVASASGTQVNPLLLSVTGTLTIDATSAIDVTGKGYLGAFQPGNPVAVGQTYPGISGSTKRSGGSHGGKGAAVYAGDVAGDVFGSLFDPAEAGGGGGGDSCCGAAGGGVVRIQATSLALAGQILADGSRYGTPGNTAPPGGGGSIRLDVSTLTGTGTIRAAGGDGTGGYFNPAGGGRVAIYGDASAFNRTQVQARGGLNGGVGGAGTVYFKAPTQSYGDLIVENGGNLGPATPLPAIGSGTVTAVSGSTLTDSSKTFPYSVVGLYVEVKHGTTVVGTYRVLSQSGSTLTLDTAIAGTVLVGDTYQGIVKLESIAVRGGAQLVTADLLAPTSGPSGALSVTPASPVLAGQTLSATVTASDPGGLSRIDLQTSGALTSTQSRTVSGSNATQTFNVTIPLTATAGSTIQIVADVYDTQSRLRRLGPQIVTVAADTTPPVLSNARPPNGSSIASGLVARIGVDAADNVGVASVDIIVDGATTTKTAPPYEILYTARSVTIPTTVPIRFVARDYAGNSAALDRSIVITPGGALQTLTITSGAVRGGAIPTGTVILSGGAPSGGAVVTLTSSNSSVASVPPNVTLPLGASWMGFPITTTTVASSTSITITATYAGETKTATLSVEPSCATPVAPAPPSLPADTVWVEDQIPTGATPFETWVWDATQKASGTQSNTDPANAGSHGHWFQGASQTLSVAAGDKLVAYVLLDSCDPPREVMLQWNDGSWEHRAFWGADLIGAGTPGTPSRYSAGPLPPSGQWVRFEVPASAVGLEGRTLNGIAFSLYGGKAWFDRAGKITPAAAANAQPTVSLTAPANGATFTHPATVNLAATASDSDGSVAKVEFFWNGILIGEDTTSPYTLTWNPLWSRSYSLTARATDNLGASTTSTPVSVSVTGGPPGPFAGVDTTTKGSWRGVYGTNGYQVMEDSVSYPSYVQVTFTGHSPYTWAASSADVRALQKAVGSDRIAATWYSDSSFTVDLNFTDTVLHRVAFYCLDWGSSSTRVQLIEVFNAASGELLDSRSLSNFEGGHYLIWNLAGRVRFRFTRTGSWNAVVSGLFFDPPTSP